MAQINLTVDSELIKGLFSADGRDEAFAALVSTILNQVLNAQASEQIGAQPYERSDERQAYRKKEPSSRKRFISPSEPI